MQILFITFLGMMGLFSSVAHADGLEQFKHFLSETRTARGTFHQTVTGKSGRKPQTSSGTFVLSKPGKFRWIYEKPTQQLLVSDGEKFWSFDPDLNQVTVRKLDRALGSSPLALLSGESLEENFILKVDGKNAEGMEFIEATPKAQEASFVRMRIGLKNRLPRFMEVHDHFGQMTTLVFDQFETNIATPANLFRFTPPKGADIAKE
ncbi:MAG: outer membrane lipoprotein chaperone LolA [Rectinemataceae bacterium]|nr:outer membrane lipoprotein chaperone LolA [Rectinemataceae bacterium]